LTLREQLIARGIIRVVPDLADMYDAGVPAPSWAQPWHAADSGLRLTLEDRAFFGLRKEWTVVDGEIVSEGDDYARYS